MAALIRRAEGQLVRRRFEAIPDLEAALFVSLVQYLTDTGRLQDRPFEAAACPGAAIRDLSAEKVAWFLRRARAERRLSLSPKVSVAAALTHLNLLQGDHPTHAALLLFGKDVQRFVPAAELKGLHFHGTEVRKPIPSYRLVKGTIFDQVDEAVDFVLSKLDQRVGTRERGPAAPAAYEIPPEVVTEAIVNAVAHRDYTSNAAVQVQVFSDRVEAWNPGALPSELTPERLRHEHPSIPRNPLIADALYRARYIEKAGTGTLDMIARCREAGLPEPDFEQRGGQFVVTLWRDWLTAEVLERFGLNGRQQEAIAVVRRHGRITNREYQELTGVAESTVLRDLGDLIRKGVIEKIGRTGRGTYYVIGRRARPEPAKRATSAQGRETRQKPAKPSTDSFGQGTGQPLIVGATKGPKGPSRPAPRRRRRGVSPVSETRQKPAKPATGSSSRGSRRGKEAEPGPKRPARRSMGPSPRGLRK